MGYSANISPGEVVRLTNERRLATGVASLKINPVLSQAALAKATDMLNKNYWAHVAPDGTEPWKFFLNAGYQYHFAGENLARDFSNPNSIIDAWMASTTHRENLLSSKYKEIGVAVIEGDLNGVETTLIVQFFGSEFSDKAAIAPIVSSETPVKPPSQKVSPVQEKQPRISSLIAKEKIVVSPLKISQVFFLGLVGLLFTVIIIDALIVHKRRISRVAGRSLAHLAFLGMILAIVLLAKAGRIL